MRLQLIKIQFEINDTINLFRKHLDIHITII